MRKIKKKSILDVHTHFKPTETFHYRQYCYGGYLDNPIDKTLSEVNFRERMSTLQNKQKTRTNILLFVTEYRLSLPNLKQFR